MTIRRILVHVDYDALPTARVELAAALAARFDATIIGFAAGTYVPIIITGGFVYNVAMVETDQRVVEQRLAERAREFRQVVGDRCPAEWRSTFAIPTRGLADEARSADLVIVGGGNKGSGVSQLDIGGLVLTSGRPVLVAAEGADAFDGRRVLIAWKDCREARRAVKDALPFLLVAETVVVAAIEEGAATRSNTEDVVAYLSAHGIEADVIRRDPGVDGPPAQLLREARAMEAGAIVAGAFGHSRLREWAFGGMTRSLLLATDVNLLMSN